MVAPLPGGSPLSKLPVLSLFYNPEIEPMISRVIAGARVSLDVAQYCFGSRQLTPLLVWFVREKGKLRILVDAGQARKPSTAFQREAMTRVAE